MKNFLLFNQLFGTEGNPNQTGETLTRENRIGLMSYLRRTLMLLFAVLVMSVGQMWGDQTWDFTEMSSADNTAYSGDATNWEWNKNGYYGNKFTPANGVWTDVISTTITQIKNMKFKRSGSAVSAGTIRVYKNSTGNTDGYLGYNNGNVHIGFTATTGDTIIVSYFNNESSSTKGYILTNLKRIKDNATTIQVAAQASVIDTLIATNTAVDIKCESSKIQLYKIVLKNPVAACSTPAAPDGLEAGSLTATGATFNITDAANTNNYEIVCKTTSGAPASDATPTATGTSKSITVSTLSAGTTYYAWVRAVCDGSHKSSWVALDPTTFTTLLAITPSLSYTNTPLVLTVRTSATPTLTGNTGSGAVTWNSSTPGVATVDASGNITAVAAGTTTITASIAANGGYEANEATAVVKVAAAPLGIVDQKLATGSVAWDASVIVTSDYTNITSLTALSQHGSATASGNGNTSNGGQTSKIGTVAAYSDDNYIEMSFTVASGKKLDITAVHIPVQPVTSDVNNFKAVLSDDQGSTEIEGTKTNLSNGTLADIDFSSYGSLKGTVTLRIYAWGHTNGYRLGKNIYITGTISDAATCPSAYSFHYGTNEQSDWTIACFEDGDETDERVIENFTIPTVPDFYVGWEGNPLANNMTARQAWNTDVADLGNGVMNGAMVLLPVQGTSKVGWAQGAIGTLRCWYGSTSKNQYVGFEPNGYAIMYGGNNYAFAETATEHQMETEVVTLPAVSTTYQMGIATADGYTTCAHSNAAEAISNMGVTVKDGGKKKILFNPAIGGGDGYVADDAKIAVYDVTNSTWDTDFMSDADGDGIYEGHVADDCETIIIARFNKTKTSTGNWVDKYNQTNDYSISGDLQKIYKIDSWCTGDNCKETISSTTTSAHPATGQKGKFRMWDNSADQNWYVHFIPYYVLSYDANGGSGTTAATERNSESSTLTVSVASNGFTAPTGYHFDGWNTLAGGSGDPYAASADYTLTANATLYAQWSANTISVTLAKGEHGAANQAMTIKYDAGSYLTFTAVSANTGYTCSGYYDGETKVLNADGSFASSTVSGYITSSKWTKADNCTLTAKWTAKTYDVTLNDQDATTSVSPSKVTATYNSSTIASITNPGKTGYTFGGWYKSEAGENGLIINTSGALQGSTDYTDGSGNWHVDAGKTVYAKWTQSITLHDNNGGEHNGSVSVTYKGTAGTPSAPTKTGYNVEGYYAEAGTTNKVMAANGTLVSDVTVSTVPWTNASSKWVHAGASTLYAKWTAKQTTITINANTANHGSTTPGTVTATYASALPSFTAASGASGYSLTGYYTDATSGTKIINADGTLVASTSYADGSGNWNSEVATLTLYAQYEEAAPAGTTYYLVTSTAQLNTTDTYVIMDDGKAAMMGVYGSNAMTAITTGFTAAADKSTVTVTSSDVNTLTLQAESSAWNIVGKDNYKLTTNTKIGENLYGNTSKATEDSKDNFVFSFADGKVTIKRDAETDFHIYYSSGTGFNQSTSSTNVRLYTSSSTPVYTVTYNLNGGTGTVPTHRAEKSGTSITLASSTGLTKDGFTFDGWSCSVNSTKYAAGASYTMTAVNTTFTAQWVAVSGYTVTYNYNGATSGASPTSATGASVTLPNPTRTGYELDGWYTTAGAKVNNGGKTYNPTADITLYARWQVACDGSGTDSSVDDVAATGYTTYQEKGGSNVVFTSAPTIGFKYKDADGNTINNSTTAVVRNNAYKCQISSDSGNKGSIKTTSTFSNVDSISFYFAASDKGGCKIAVWCSTDDFSADSTQLLSATNYADNNGEFKLKTLAIPSGQKASALRFKFRFTVTSSGKTSYIDSLKIYSSTASSGTCYHVYYHGNGAESGFVSDTTSYADGAKATVLSYNDSRYPLTKDGYDFQGWATSVGGSAAYSDGQKITIDGADVHLYATWATASSALVTWKMKTADNEAWATTTGTGTTDGTNISSIGTSHDEGNNKADNSATAKTAMASGEVSSTAAPDKSARFTFTIGATKQVEISKFDCKVFNVSDGSRTYKAQISDEAGNVYNSTNTVPVSASATLTDASFVFGSGKILRGDVTIRIYAWKTSGSPTEFRMGPDVKFYGTVDDYACATPSAPTISGASEYAVGQTITLTASHDGENYDNLTTYTWYRGANWATASAASPVQDADTGEDGYTLTKTAVAADDDLFWCKVSNGTCEAHNTTGYNVNVYAANTITWHLNDGEWGEVEHKDSYSRFDDDYTLPVPSKDGYVFAGWYEASDFSGLPISTLESGSVGDREYWAKWGSAVTATWTITKVDDALYRGGGGYSVTAVINQADWDDYGDKDDLVLTATEGVTLKNVVKSINGEGKAQVFANFDITTGLEADATEITFTLDVPANGTYAPAELSHDEDLTDCGGGASGYTEFFSMIPKANTCSITNTEANSAPNHFTTCECTSSATITAGGSVTYGLYSSGTGTTSKYWEYNGKNGGWKHSIANSWVVLYSTDQFKAGDSIVITNGNSSSSGYYTIVASASNNTADYHSVSQVAAPSTTSPAKNTNYYYKLPASFVSSNYLVIRSSTSSACYVGTIKAYHAGAKGGVTPTLSWTPALASDGDWDSENNRLNKETGDVDFTFVAGQDKNSLGAITYSSNNPSVATVNAAGTVHIVGAAGDATITATLAASGCFGEATATYNIQVVDNCIDEPGTISTTDLGCSGIEMTVSGHTTSGETVSYQWYKVGTPDETVGTNSTTFTTTEAGEYYVVVTNTGTDHCSMASTNTVKVASKAAATATKIVDSWYVKNGRRTPDVALVQTAGATGFIVKSGETIIWESAGSTKTGFGGCGFHMGTDGIIYLNGTKDDGDATTGLTAGDVTLKITANDGCGSSASELSITIHCQEATTYKEIAFVVDGDKGKDFDQVTSGHADGTELYEYLDSVGTAAGKRLFCLTEQNIYSTTDEKAIRQHYSQYDAILITDDPSTNKVPNKEDYKTGGYVNAFGTMIDVRPILTMEAYVSALKNWGSKGIAGNPQSPNPRQYEMRLECKDHEIYGTGLPDPEDGTNVWEEVIDGETFRHVIVVDSTLGIYNGVAYNVETAGDKKPALQGFTGEAAGSLLGLGRILEGTLQAAIERQEEPAARLLVFGINAKALHETCALTDEGKTVIKNILVYLLKTNMEEVDDCSNYFTGKINNDWSNAGNWSKSALPSTEAKVRILAPCVVSGSHPHVAQVAIVSSGKSSIRETATGSPNCNGSLTINANGALIVEGEVLAAEAPHFAANDLKPTTVNELIINTNGSGQAALIFDNEEAKTKATVNLYSLGRVISSTYQFQYMAVPMEVVPVNPSFANETHGGTMILTYVWNENGGWERRGYYEDLRAFECVGITTGSTSTMNYTMKGNLASTAEKEITLTNSSGAAYANNIIGNSWTAPIDIASLKEAIGNDNNVQKTIYIYVTGNDGDDGASSGTSEDAGQWLAIPIEGSGWSGWSGLKVIPAMQAFLIRVSAETSLELNYNDVVRKTATENLNEPLRAPRRAAADKDITMTTIHVADSKTYADLRLFEGDRFSEAFDNGWEAEYLPCDGRTATLYAETEAGQMAVAALPELEGTVLGFAPGKETEYTFTFLGGNGEYYLNDLKLKNSTLMSAENSYVFTFEEGDTNRFYISRTAINAPEVATGMENLDAAAPKAQKIIYNDKLYILRGGKVFSADGQLVK